MADRCVRLVHSPSETRHSVIGPFCDGIAPNAVNRESVELVPFSIADVNGGKVSPVVMGTGHEMIER